MHGDMVGGTEPLVSVLVVSDYQDGREQTWSIERAILGGLSRQTLVEPFEVILVESDRRNGEAPPDLLEICPAGRVVYAPATQSAMLKDWGVGHARADLIAVFEADCVPDPSWLGVLVDVLRRHSEVSAVSGRTTYGAETMYRRALGLVDRSFDDLERAGPSSQISNNAALYRRHLLRDFPYPPAITPFTSARLRIAAMRAAGHGFYFEPQATVRHAVGGLRFIRDFRRNIGYSDMAGHPQPAVHAIPTLLGRRTRREIHDCLRLGRRDLRWYDWPLVPLLLLVARVLEIPGMLDALRRRKEIPGTAYR